MAVHNMYLEGEFERAIGILEAVLKTKTPVTHGDSVFIYRHLGVMYAASENTRERGKHYMYKLISAEPFSNILDMYASDMIYMIFKNVKDEFEAARTRMERAEKYLGKGDGLGKSMDSSLVGRTAVASPAAKAAPRSAPMPAKASPPTKEGKGKSAQASTYYWVGGTSAVVVGLGVLGWLHAEEVPKKSRRVFGTE